MHFPHRHPLANDTHGSPDRTNHLLRRIEDLARVGYGHWNFDGSCASISHGLSSILGQRPDWRPSLREALKLLDAQTRNRLYKQIREMLAQRKKELDFVCCITNRNGEVYLRVQLAIDSGPDKPACLLLIAHDISKQKHYESHLQNISFRDPLTGLPNRTLLNDRLNQALINATRSGSTLGLMVLDLDRFKAINDSHGHAMGDRLLYECAQRLRALVRDYDTVARLGWDEFSIVLPNLQEPANLGKIATNILDCLSRPFSIADKNLFITASVGIASFPSDGDKAADLLRCAGLALHESKKKGRSGYCFHDSELTARSQERAELEEALHRAEIEQALELHFQPKIDLSNGKLVGAEALLRWQHPTLGMLLPDRFIGIAEDSGLIVSIGLWVLTKACLVVRRWNQPGKRELKIAVNLSARQFINDDLLATVQSVLSLTGCEPQWLELEITESLLLGDDNHVSTTLHALRKMGISIAIDDFGTGFSSLGYLKRFPIKTLKIDRSFTRDIGVDQDSTELVKAIIQMAHSLRLELVAEGVETEEQEIFLKNHGCRLGQGYRYGKPISQSEFESMPALAFLTHPRQRKAILR